MLDPNVKTTRGKVERSPPRILIVFMADMPLYSMNRSDVTVSMPRGRGMSMDSERSIQPGRAVMT